MRVLFSAYGPRGTVEPLAALAVALRDLGADVLMCAPPDEEFAELLAGAGVPVVAAGAPVRELVTTVVPGSAEGLAQRVAALMDAQFGIVAAAAEGCDAIVATGPLPVVAGARSVAEKLGIRYVHASHTPIGLPSPGHRPPGRRGRPLPADVTDNGELWKLDAEIAQDMFGAALNAQRATLGLPPVDDVRSYAFTEQPWLATDPVLSPWQPTSLGVVQTGAWVRRDDRPLPAQLEAFLAAGEPPVYAGFGSSPMNAAPDIAQVVAGAVQAQGRRLVLARGWASLDLAGDHGDCLVVDEVNHDALFGRVAAVVHHGSGGITTRAALAGVPQVVVPQGADQPYWASRVAELGIGVAHDGPAPTVDSLSLALTAALDPDVRARAATVAGTVRPDGARAAAANLLAGA
ncbi:glycosyltransferase [Longispora albida]|uniref:glycosyltransferase n=1 Tax=Longispora albida TaxID=203523 RepID=UPI00036187DA|nr:glycosyltransferase [Longispora albida]